MKKAISFLLVAVLSLSLVACQPKAKETKGETTTETKTETTAETGKEAPNTKTGETKAEVVVETVALLGNTVVAGGAGLDQKIVKLEAKNYPQLNQGFKYTFNAEKPEIKNPLVVEKVEMLGKQIGYTLDTKLVDEVLKLEGVKVVDARSEEEFKKGHIKGAINLVPEKVEELVGKVKEDKAAGIKEYLKGFTGKDIVVILGEDAAKNAKVAQALYKYNSVPVQLNAGLVKDYTGKLVTE